MKRKAQCNPVPVIPGIKPGRGRRFSSFAAGCFAVLAGLTAGLSSGQTLVADGRVLVSTNNQNFDISVFDGRAMYNDLGNGVITLT
ncbi:MAG: hypothetical protein PVJ98_06090, partial [Akkermansiaceae bacterium]